MFLSDEGPMLETLDYTIRIGSTPTFSYFDLYLYSAYAAHYVYKVSTRLFDNLTAVGTICINIAVLGSMKLFANVNCSFTRAIFLILTHAIESQKY